MSTAQWSLCFALIALTISVWGRLETFYINSRQRRLDLAKQIGDALLSTQILKITLDKNIDALELVMSKLDQSKVAPDIYQGFVDGLAKTQKDHKLMEDFIKHFEKINNYFEDGVHINLEPAAMEATIARFRQKREMALFDIEYLNNFYETKIKGDEAF